ncbi:hypothetical protein AB0J52_33310, partial [Spirillospora sp. NPDC049652]
RAAAPRRNGPGRAQRGAAGLVRCVAHAPQGSRNNLLYWAACCAARDGHHPEVFEDLVAAAVRAGLPEREARAAVASARRRIPAGGGR